VVHTALSKWHGAVSVSEIPVSVTPSARVGRRGCGSAGCFRGSHAVSLQVEGLEVRDKWCNGVVKKCQILT